MKIKMGVFSLMLLFSLCSVILFEQVDKTDSDSAVYLNNVGVTKCWKGTCGHKSKYYTYPAYTTTGRYTTYFHTGFYLEPGATQTISFSKTVSQSLNVGGNIGSDVAKASLGFSGGLQKTMSSSQSMKNNQKKRRYPHLGVEFANRKNTVTVKTRTYNPTWHVTAVNKNCKYSTQKANPTCKIAVACGLSLRSSISNQ